MKTTITIITGTICLAASAHAQEAVQWRVEDGGNGHWYACLRDASGMTVFSAAGRAAARGAHLFTGCSAEFDFAVGAVDALNPIGWVAWGNHWWGPWIGLRRDGSSGQFSWPDSTSCTFDRWDTLAGQPDPANEDAVMLYSTSPQSIALCHDISSLQATRSALIEWDADCNADGIVDYGQCRDGSVPDQNANNVPDCCEGIGTCCVGDILVDQVVNGADLGGLLSYWGPVTASPVSQSCDLNNDGVVGGGDLGLLLANWGSCPN